MRGLQKQRRIQIIVLAVAMLAIATVLIGRGLREGINFFMTPSEVAESQPPSNQVFRIGGMVEVGSLERGQGETITFKVTDFAASIPVAYTGVLPDLFGENEGMVGTGSMVDGVFVASEILARHDETYMPAEVIEALEAQGYDYQAPAQDS